MAVDDGVREQLVALGEFIRAHPQAAQLAVRDLAERANVSNPYLSQIERGLHAPSMRVLKSISDALNISIESLLARAGLGDSAPTTPPGSATVDAILADPALTEDQRESLLAVYRSYVGRPGPDA